MTPMRPWFGTSERVMSTNTLNTLAPEAAICQLMREFSLDPVMLEDNDSGLLLSLSYGLVC